MKIRECLRWARARLDAAGIDEAPLESELLLRHALALSPVELYLALEKEVASSHGEVFERLVQRRLAGEPVAYILGRREFYGLDFCVNSSVLVPRPETEILVEQAITLAQTYTSPLVADIGTGSGAIAVGLAKSLPRARIYASDISAQALEIARLNAKRHGVEPCITFLIGNLAEPLPEPVDILIANLPYVKSNDCANSPEPHLALDGGADGLDTIARLCGMLDGKLRPGGSVLLEVGQGQSDGVTGYLSAALPVARITMETDLAGIERVVSAHLPAMVPV